MYYFWNLKIYRHVLRERERWLHACKCVLLAWAILEKSQLGASVPFLPSSQTMASTSCFCLLTSPSFLTSCHLALGPGAWERNNFLRSPCGLPTQQAFHHVTWLCWANFTHFIFRLFLNVFHFPDSYSLKIFPVSHHWASSYFSLRNQRKRLQESLPNLSRPLLPALPAEYASLLLNAWLPHGLEVLWELGLCPPASAVDSPTWKDSQFASLQPTSPVYSSQVNHFNHVIPSSRTCSDLLVPIESNPNSSSCVYLITSTLKISVQWGGQS